MEKSKTINSVNEQECDLYSKEHAVRPEFDEYKVLLADFYESDFVYDVIYIEKLSGKPTADIFRRLSQDTLGNYRAVNSSKGKLENLKVLDKKYVSDLISKVEKGHFMEDCTGFVSSGKVSILLLKINNKIQFSYVLTKSNLEGLSAKDKSNIKNGYALAEFIKDL